MYTNIAKPFCTIGESSFEYCMTSVRHKADLRSAVRSVVLGFVERRSGESVEAVSGFLDVTKYETLTGDSCRLHYLG